MHYSLYTDGSHFAHFKIAGIGGYLLDENNDLVWDFSEELENPETFTSHESQALLYGLKKCINSGITHLRCFSDDNNLSSILNIANPVERKMFANRNSTNKQINELLNQFTEISFHYIPRKENKWADSLSRKKLLKHIQGRSQVVEGALNLPNLFRTQQYGLKEKSQFADLKRNIKTHYMFKLIELADEMKLEVYEVSRFPEIKVQSVQTHTLNNNWTRHHIEIIKDVLSNSEADEVGIIFQPESTIINKMFRGIEKISKKSLSVFQDFEEISYDFSKIVVHNDSDIVHAVIPKVINEKRSLPLEELRIFYIESIRTLGQDNYKLGDNTEIETHFELNKQKSESVEDIQKYYFGQLVSLNRKIETEKRRKNLEIIARMPKNEREDKVENLKKELTSQGIKLKM